MHRTSAHLIRVSLLASACLLLAPCLSAATLSGTVKDPSGAFVSGAAVSAQPLPKGTPLNTTTDDQGRFHFPDAPASSYTLIVNQPGFEPWERKINLSTKSTDVSVSLKLTIVTESVKVSGRRSPLANSDPNYIALRTGKLSTVYRIENLTVTRDVGTFVFHSGSFSFLPPIMGHLTTGVFVGEGNFQLKPSSTIDVNHLRHIAGVDSVNEDFSAAVVYFTDSTFDEIKQHSQKAEESTERHEEAFQRVKNVIQTRREPNSPLMPGGRPLTLLERLLNYEDIPNYEAEVLAELYNSQAPSFRAFLHGKKHGDLRFLVNPHGALPVLAAPEEVALINNDTESDTDGVWYLAHFATEIQSGRASSKEEKRIIVPEHYQIDALARTQNLIGKQPDLAATCDLQLHSLEDGTRMVKFGMWPDLQISRVVWNGKEIPFIQEGRKKDGSFYMQMPEPMVKGRSYHIVFEYSGPEILQSDYGPPPPRRVWYPTPSGPASRATYDLKFHVPRGMTIVSVGKLVSETRDGAFETFEFSADAPIPQAVFRYLGPMYTKASVEETTHTDLRAYVQGGRGTGARAEAPPPGPRILQANGTVTTPQAQRDPTALPAPPQPQRAPWASAPAAAPVRAGVQPSSPGDVLIDAGNSVRIFNSWFGPPAYHSLSVIVAPGVTDSLPGLVFANPLIMAGSGGLSALGGAPGRIKTVLDEAFARVVARQWWGNTIGPASFHDEWLSDGFANFSTSLYDLTANISEFSDHWDKAREALLHPPGNRYYVSEMRPIDAGPIWMGLLNDTPKTPGAWGIVNVSKGGFVLHMLRSMMWDPTTIDNDFRAMMQDYVKQFTSQSVSTEDFKSIVEKHMKPVMDLDGNHTMDWFFNEWVYGTDIPSYHLEYSLSSNEDGKTLLTGTLTQSGVSAAFAMPVPVFAEFGTRKARVGMISIRGNSSKDFKVLLPASPTRISLTSDHEVLTDKEEVKQLH